MDVLNVEMDCKKGVCAIVVSYNPGIDILASVNSIKNQVDEVIIVDNGSGATTLDHLKCLEKCPGLTVYYNYENLGITGALNKGIRYALDNNYSWILTLDGDSTCASDMVSKMFDAYEIITSNLFSVKCGIIEPHVHDIYANAELVKLPSKSVDYIVARTFMTSGSLIKDEVFYDIGLFDERFFMHYADVDLSLRARKAGYAIILATRAKLLHAEGKKDLKKLFGYSFFYYNYNPVANYYIFRNSIKIIKKHNFYDYYVFDHCLRRILIDLVKIMFFSRQKSTDFKYSLLGVWHGLKGISGRIPD